MVVIAAGSAGGGLILLLTLSLVITITMALCYKHKQLRAYHLKTNVAYTRRTKEHTVDGVELDHDVMYEDIQKESIQESASEAQQSSGEALPLSVMQNVAYTSSAMSVSLNVAYKPSAIPVSLNVAYKSEQGLKRFGDDEYDYII